MDILITLIWIIVVTSFSVFGAWYARKYNRADAIIGLYVAFILISNIIAYKIAAYDFGFITLYTPASVLVFAVTFLLTDIVNEKFGRAETQRMILIAFVCQIAVAFFIWLALTLNSAPFWLDQEVFAKVLSFTPRIMFASWIAFLISENADAYIFAWFKKITKGRHLWMRNALSSLPSMAIDTILFVTIAFYGLQSLLPLIFGNIALKWLVGIINIPFMYWNRRIMSKK